MTEPVVTPTENLEKIEAKLDKGEALSPEEEKLISGPADVPEEIDPDTVIIKKDEKDSKPAVTPAEKDAKAPEAKEKEGADTAGQIAERRKKIQEDVEKPLDEVNMEDYTPNETAMFYEMKGERRKRQDAQRETDTLKFERAKETARRQIAAEKEAEEAKAKAEKEQDPFDGVEDDDLLTAGQLKKFLASQKKEGPKIAPEAQDRANKLILENWHLKAQIKLPGVDLQTITALADEVLMRNGTRDPDAVAEVDDVVAKGGNPIIATYNFLRSHPKYGPILEERLGKVTGDPEKKAKDEEARTNKERAERIEANKKKPVTTGSGGGAATSGDYSIQELIDMPEAQFAKLPKAQRDRILETF